MVCYTFTCLAVGCKFVRYKDWLVHHQSVLNNISVLVQITDKTHHLCTSGKVLFWESLAQVVFIFIMIFLIHENRRTFITFFIMIFYLQAIRLRTLFPRVKLFVLAPPSGQSVYFLLPEILKAVYQHWGAGGFMVFCEMAEQSFKGR